MRLIGWHFANNNDTTTLAAVADALVSSLRDAGVSPLSVATAELTTAFLLVWIAGAPIDSVRSFGLT